MTSYIERKKQMADIMGVDQEDCRVHDQTGLHAVKIGGQRELAVVCHDTELAAITLRNALEDAK